jgi:hypothetical protein
LLATETRGSASFDYSRFVVKIAGNFNPCLIERENFFWRQELTHRLPIIPLLPCSFTASLSMAAPHGGRRALARSPRQGAFFWFGSGSTERRK